MDTIKLPVAFEKRMRNLLGSEEFGAFIEAISDPAERAFHINKLKIAPDDFRKMSPFGEEKISRYENGYFFKYSHIGHHPYHHAGMIYIQDPGAMFALEGVNINPGWKILDLCAAPGGKSSQAAQALGGTGYLVSNEIIPSRCKILTGNFERLGYANTSVTCASPDKVVSSFGSYFDLVICDAPCSGEGMFRKNPEAISEWSEEKVQMCADRQKSILESAVLAVKPGGYLLYSTCTFAPEENELSLKKLIEVHPEFEIVPLKSDIFNCTVPGIEVAGIASENARRFYFHTGKGEGQFAALLRNTGNKEYSSSARSVLLPLSAQEKKAVIPFIDELLKGIDMDWLFMSKDNVVYRNPDYLVPEKLTYMAGITIGQLKNGRLVPHHQVFSALGTKMQKKIDLHSEDDRITRYLKGESFEFNGENGWYSLCVDGCAIGGVRLVNNYAKNLYPRGLQNLL